MIFDKENLFSDKQAVAATAVSANIIDLGGPDAGAGDRPYLAVHATPFTGTGTLSVELQTSADSAFGTPKIVAAFPVANDTLKKGGQIVAGKPPKGMLRYARLNYAVTGTLAGGALTAGLVLDL